MPFVRKMLPALALWMVQSGLPVAAQAREELEASLPESLCGAAITGSSATALGELDAVFSALENAPLTVEAFGKESINARQAVEKLNNVSKQPHRYPRSFEDPMPERRNSAVKMPGMK